MVRFRLGLARAGAITALVGLTAGELAGPSAATPANDPAGVQTLMSHLSSGYTPADCTPATTGKTTQAVALVICAANHDPGGPESAGYLLFANIADLNADFQRGLADPNFPVRPFPDGTNGPTQWNRGAHSGSVVLLGAPGHVAQLVWTDIPARMLVGATLSTAPGYTDAALYNWWQTEGVR